MPVPLAVVAVNMDKVVDVDKPASEIDYFKATGWVKKALVWSLLLYLQHKAS